MRQRELQLRRSSALNWEEIGDHDVIFIGSLSSDPRLQEIPVKWAFEVRANEIINLNPLAGESNRYISKLSLAPGPLLKGATNAIPQFFQIVIRSRFQSMVPVEISYVTHRRL